MVTMSMTPGYFKRKQKKKRTSKPFMLHLLIAYSWQLETLVKALGYNCTMSNNVTEPYNRKIGT